MRNYFKAKLKTRGTYLPKQTLVFLRNKDFWLKTTYDFFLIINYFYNNYIIIIKKLIKKT